MTVNRLGQYVEELAWFKSSYSAGDGGECVEVAMGWHKSSHSTGAGGECLEMAVCLHAIHVRDSKNTTCTGLTVGASAWTAFVGFAA
ncbi:DUF397 domain-containing protein [Streptomyces nojiriensis]|uniref:DUF397 domain-containing protein n=1 Tax=Streptomyces nojiriensis TaxID=66374 RepID=UPI0036501458